MRNQEPGDNPNENENEKDRLKEQTRANKKKFANTFTQTWANNKNSFFNKINPKGITLDNSIEGKASKKLTRETYKPFLDELFKELKESKTHNFYLTGSAARQLRDSSKRPPNDIDIIAIKKPLEKQQKQYDNNLDDMEKIEKGSPKQLIFSDILKKTFKSEVESLKESKFLVKNYNSSNIKIDLIIDGKSEVSKELQTTIENLKSGHAVHYEDGIPMVKNQYNQEQLKAQLDNEDKEEREINSHGMKK